VSVAPALPTSCTVARLPLPRGLTLGVAVAVDPTGRYAVGSSSVEWSTTREHLLLWDGDEVRRLELPGQGQRFIAVTSSGTALATTVLNEREQTSWVYRDGKFTRLKGGGVVDLIDMNDSGVVVGTEQADGPVGKSTGGPVRWRSSTSEMERLPLPPGDWPSGVSVAGIDDDGTIIMNAHRGHLLDWQPFALRPDGTWQKLTAPVSMDGMANVQLQASAIRGGWVTGEARLPANAESPQPRLVGILWNLDTGEAVTLPRGGSGSVVNALGWIAAGLDEPQLWSPTGAWLALPAPPEQTSEFPAYVTGLSDDGRVLVGGVQLNDDRPDVLPLRWRCS
jgi:hypothetical protein